MFTLFKGYAGTGKTTRLLHEIYTIIETNQVSPDFILILTLSPREEKVLKDLNSNNGKTFPLYITTLDKFCGSILNKSLDFTLTESISEEAGISIISSLCKQEFSANPQLLSLTKSRTFASELYSLFILLKSYEINDTKLTELISNANISETDRQRLNLIASVYKKYDDFLASNNLKDYRDLTANTIKCLQEHPDLLSYYQNLYQYIFIDGFQNISPVQLKLLKLLFSNKAIYVTGDENSRIQSYKGAMSDNLSETILSDNFKKVKVQELTEPLRNKDILQRALYLIESIPAQNNGHVFKTSHSIKYFIVDDLEEEIRFIANRIKYLVEENQFKYADFAIFIRQKTEKQSFIDLLKDNNIPVSSELFNEKFKNLRLKIILYLNICNILEKLNLEKFDTYELYKVQLPSKVDHENYIEALNSYFVKILNDLLPDSYAREQFLSIMETQQTIPLPSIINMNLKSLSEKEQQKVKDEFYRINKLYQDYKELNLTAFINRVVDFHEYLINNYDTAKLLAGLVNRVNRLTDINLNILKEKPAFDEIIELFNQPDEELTVTYDAVQILTPFKAAGQECKVVFIPCLTENTFPRKPRNTSFISPDGNQAISEDIKKGYPGFRSLVETEDEEYIEEAKLFYTAMTRASDLVYLSSHIYEDKKKVLPSIFLRNLMEIDPENVLKLVNKLESAEMVDAMTAEELKVEVSEELVPVIDTESIKLSISSISQYFCCPRNYFYEGLLKLKKEETDKVSTGLAVHTIMSVFNKHLLEGCTKENLIRATEIYFNALNDTDAALAYGYEKRDIDRLRSIQYLKLGIMKAEVLDAINSMEAKGFFGSEYIEIEDETKCEYTDERIPDVVFSGRIDAIAKHPEGYDIIDYKTGKDKNPLTYFVSQDGVEFKTATGKPAKNPETYAKKYEYQLPLYCLALRKQDKYRDTLRYLKYQYIRPVSKDDGYKEDSAYCINVNDIEEKLIQNLKETVIQPLRETVKFEMAEQSFMICDNCTFNFLCDRKDGEDDSE
jgi:superfamily I DNA/RNA helicase